MKGDSPKSMLQKLAGSFGSLLRGSSSSTGLQTEKVVREENPEYSKLKQKTKEQFANVEYDGVLGTFPVDAVEAIGHNAALQKNGVPSTLEPIEALKLGLEILTKNGSVGLGAGLKQWLQKNAQAFDRIDVEAYRKPETLQRVNEGIRAEKQEASAVTEDGKILQQEAIAKQEAHKYLQEVGILPSEPQPQSQTQAAVQGRLNTTGDKDLDAILENLRSGGVQSEPAVGSKATQAGSVDINALTAAAGAGAVGNTQTTVITSAQMLSELDSLVKGLQGENQKPMEGQLTQADVKEFAALQQSLKSGGNVGAAQDAGNATITRPKSIGPRAATNAGIGRST